MTKRIVLFLLAACSLSACAATWSATGENGVSFEQAEPECREQARQSALRQMPFWHDRDYGPAGFPLITRRDVEERETARCLLDKGFTLSRE